MKENQNPLNRQEATKKIINENLISDQNQIVDLLKKKYGIETNQAVVSRDLRKLGVIKKLVKGTMVYELEEIDIQTEIFKLALLDISYNETMIVIKTRPGLSAFVGDYLDQCNDLNILGCLAGENVVFIIPKTVTELKVTYDSLCKKFQKKQEITHD